MIDWQVLATLMAPIITLFVGVWASRRFESGPVLLTHWGHVSSFNHQGEDGNKFTVNTHTVVISNVGRRAATNVRLSHNYLPSYNIWPRIQHRVEEVPDSSNDIVIPAVIPNQQLTISYLYFHPMTFAEINAGVRCDQGFAVPITVLLQRQHPRWLKYIVGTLVIVGMSTLVYGLFELGALIAPAILN